jgi:hypothetical protein
MAILSGVFGSALTLIVGTLVFLARRPRLMAFFASRTRGCVVDTPSAVGQQRTLRVLVENWGWTSAHDVVVSVWRIAFYPPNGVCATVADEVLELRLALTERTAFDLPPGGRRWVDVAYADEAGGDNALRFGFPTVPMRINQLGFGGVGYYSFKVVITAHNASAVPIQINWSWNGTRQGLSIERTWWPIIAFLHRRYRVRQLAAAISLSTGRAQSPSSGRLKKAFTFSSISSHSRLT